MTARAPSIRAQRRLALAVGAAWIALHYWVFARFLPTANGTLGFDYGYFLPQLLDGEYWRIANGAFALQWFTPAFCGGIPKFANPQSLSFSVPQAFAALVDPLAAVRLTLLVFGAIGYAGFYRFQRRLFGVSRPIASLGAALFLFNTCFSSRMLIGHLTFHAFMLVPWLPLWLFAGSGDSWRDRALASAGAAGVVAYLASQAIAHVLFQALLITAVAGLLQLAFAPQRADARGSALRIALAAPLSLALCAAKLAAMAAFLGQFPRTLYPLAGVADVPDLLWLAFRSLFLTPSDALIQRVLVNAPWPLLRHEFEFGVSPLPLVLVALALLVRSVRRQPLLPRAALRGVRGATLAVAALLLAVPVALNFHEPGWHALLKSLPVFASSSTLFRWLSVYVPIAILAGSLAIDRTLVEPAQRTLVLAIASVVFAGWQLAADRSGYVAQAAYDPQPVLDAYARSHEAGFAPEIRAIAAPAPPDLAMSRRNAVIARGESSLDCYETLFGFYLEALPRGRLHEGPVLAERDGALNLFDPSCFLFPNENGCAPGASFRAARRSDAQAFAAYRPFPFAMPAAQRTANAANALALIAVAGGVLVELLVRAWRASTR